MESLSWQPSASLQHLTLRATVLQNIRQFFRVRDVLEVDTPMLSQAAVTDPNIESLSVSIAGEDAPRYLHTSPEFPMKRLLAAGMPDMYQICRVFRRGEQGARHNPEFSMLEWYRLDFDHHMLMGEVDDLIRTVLMDSVQLAAPVSYSYREVMARYADIADVHEATVADVREALVNAQVEIPQGMDEDDLDMWLDWLMTQVVAPRFSQQHLTFIYDYPESQAALARTRDLGAYRVAERFEAYLGELELANGFHELTSGDEQQSRFEAEQVKRRSLGLEVPPYDQHLIDALAAGLPRCAGVALGIDRLLMVAAGTAQISDVLAFPFDRA